MMASVIKRSLIAVLFFTATIFVQQCLSEGTVQDNFLLVAGRPNLYQIDLASGAIVSLLATPRAGIVAVAYDPVEMVVYWTDVFQGQIGKDSLNGSRQYSTIIFQDPMGSVPLDGFALDGLELDIVNRKLYYADAGDFYPKIVEMNLDGSRPVTIVNGAGMKPRALVLDTENRDLYYTDWGNRPGIYVINLSTHQSKKIPIDKLVYPNALAIDFAERVMYWADAALHRVEMANLDGSGRVMLVNDLSAHYYAMALGPQYLYITDWYHNAVKRLDRKTYATSEQMPNVTGQLYGLVYYHSFARDTKKPTDGTTLEPVNYKSTTNNGTKILGDGATGKNSSAPQIESTTVIIAATVAGGVVLITGMITLTVCCITKRKRAPVVEEPHYMTTVTSSQSSGDKASEAYINLNPYETIEDDYI